MSAPSDDIPGAGPCRRREKKNSSPSMPAGPSTASANARFLLPEMNACPSSVTVIGAGVGGLTCAALLARAGQKRHALREERPRRRQTQLAGGIDGYTWDMGPSLLTMPYVFEQLWQKLGRRLQDDLTLIPLPVTCRYRWTDGTVIDEDAVVLAASGGGAFFEIRTRPLRPERRCLSCTIRWQEWWRQVTLEKSCPSCGTCRKIASFKTMDKVVRHFFGHDPHLAQLFNRFATYNGSSPYKTPAAFNIIAYVEAKFGGWYVQGGLYEIARALERGFAGKRGWKSRPPLKSRNSITATAQRHRRDHFILRHDDGATRRITMHGGLQSGCAFRLPPFSPSHGRTAEMDRTPWNEPGSRPSQGFVHLPRSGTPIPAAFPPQHLLFRRLSGRVSPALRSDRQPAREPTIYVAVHSKADPRPRPARLRELVRPRQRPLPSPRRSAGTLGTAIAEKYGDQIIQRLETRFGFDGLRASDPGPAAIHARQIFRPGISRRLAVCTGFASHGVRAAFQRPKLQPPGIPDFYFRRRFHPSGWRLAAGLPERTDGRRQNPAPWDEGNPLRQSGLT